MTDYSIVNAGIDWLTATTREDRIGYKWYEMLLEYEKTYLPVRVPRVDWRNRWYAGTRIESVAFGHSERLGYIVIVSGTDARDWGLRFYPHVGGVSRIDLQVTINLPKPAPLYAQGEYARVVSRKDRKYTLITNSRDGQTLYVGSRHSDQMGRLYDKGAKSGSATPGKRWRYEVEIKKPRSLNMAQLLYESQSRGENTTGELVSYVWQWFNKRGVRPIFAASCPPLVCEAGGTITTLDKKLAWLRTQVAPTVEMLITAGLGRDVADIFGDKLANEYEQLKSLAAIRQFDKNTQTNYS